MAPRRPPREARGGRIAAYVTDEQRSAAGGIGVILDAHFPGNPSSTERPRSSAMRHRVLHRTKVPVTRGHDVPYDGRDVARDLAVAGRVAMALEAHGTPCPVDGVKVAQYGKPYPVREAVLAQTDDATTGGLGLVDSCEPAA